eukprot:5311307-Prymnesium_polylepis.1
MLGRGPKVRTRGARGGAREQGRGSKGEDSAGAASERLQKQWGMGVDGSRSPTRFTPAARRR